MSVPPATTPHHPLPHAGPPPSRWLSGVILFAPALLCGITGFTLRTDEKHVLLAVFFLISIPGSILCGILAGLRLAARYARSARISSAGVASFVLFCISTAFIASVITHLAATLWPAPID